MNKKVKKVVKPAARWLAKRSSLADDAIGKIRTQRQRKALKSAMNLNAQDDKTILFMSFRGRSYADSPKAIFQELIADPSYADWKFIWAFSGATYRKFAAEKGETVDFIDSDSHYQLSQDEKSDAERMLVVRHGSQEYYRALAVSKYWVSNFRIPDGVTPTADKVYVQTWHGTPIKRLGADIMNDKVYPTKTSKALIEWYQLEAKKWTYLVAQSDYFTEKLTSAFTLDQLAKMPKVLMEGSPRNSALAKATAEDAKGLRQQLGLPEGKKVALYAPTFRDNQHSSRVGHTYKLALDLAKLKQDIGDEWVILCRFHYLVSNEIDLAPLKGFAWNVSEHEDINDLYIASDLLISDYSSSLVDYTVTGKPILVYAYDLEEYENDLRGFYIPIEEFPGKVLQTQEELTGAILSLDESEKIWKKRRVQFASRFTPKDDAETAKRVAAIVFGTNEQGSSSR
jgi:CDP-glycerol glycerophosphotransferase